MLRGFLGAWTLLVKICATVFAVSSGLTLGKEGPLVHLGACVGNVACRLFRKFRLNPGMSYLFIYLFNTFPARSPVKKLEILSTHCAAAIACAFGAPLGGVLFALEEMTYFWTHKIMWRSFFGGIISVVVLSVSQLSCDMHSNLMCHVCSSFFVQISMVRLSSSTSQPVRHGIGLRCSFLPLLASSVVFWVPFFVI